MFVAVVPALHLQFQEINDEPVPFTLDSLLVPTVNPSVPNETKSCVDVEPSSSLSSSAKITLALHLLESRIE